MKDRKLKLTDQLEKDLAGWQLRKVYYLKLDHNLMGFFPGIYKQDREMVVTTDESLLKRVWKMLPERKSSIKADYALVNMQEHYAFIVDDSSGFDTRQSVEILTDEEFEKLSADGAEPFRWAPGLVG